MVRLRVYKLAGHISCVSHIISTNMFSIFNLQIMIHYIKIPGGGGSKEEWRVGRCSLLSDYFCCKHRIR